MSLEFIFGDVCHLAISGQVVFCLSPENEAQTDHAIGVRFAGIREWEQKVLLSVLEEFRQNTTTQKKSFLKVFASQEALSLEIANSYARSSDVFNHPSATIHRSSVHASKVIGWGSYLPPREITNRDINTMVSMNGSKNIGDIIGTLTGIKSRRYAGSDLYPSDLAAQASLRALKNAGMDAKDVEVIIFCGVSRDVEEPATANIVQEKIGAHNAYAFDLSNACNGFVSAMDVMDSFIASGRCDTGLVVVGEVISQYIDWQPHSKSDLKLSLMGYTLGDGGGAAVMHRADGDSGRGLRARWFLTDSSYWRVAVVPLMERKKRLFKSNGYEIERVALKYVPAGVEETLKMLDWDIDDVDLVIPHQVSSEIIENLFFKSLGMPPEKVFWSYPMHGNVGAASMPIALCEALDQQQAKTGDKILLVGGSGGFGVGIIGLIV
jgi:3-oxoacyl-[acyl-carrier-protein] synthase-3